MKQKKVFGYISDIIKNPKYIQEEFKGIVIDKEIRFPKKLGADHPFNFEDMEKAFKKIGPINGIINKLKNAIVGDFQVKAKNKNIQTFLNSFIEETNFSSFLREWIKEALVKGNGFAELDLDNNRIRVLNANNMYVRRNKKGKVLEYNQWLGMTFRNMSRESRLLTSFKPSQIAHLKLNKIANEPYAIGIIYPNERTITNLVQLDQNQHKLIDRKAGAPIHVQVGREDENPDTEAIDDMSGKLQFMNTRTEWVTDANTKMNILDFGPLGKSLSETMESDMQMLSTGINLPMVFLGRANIPEGLAKAQGEDRQRFIESIREEIENIIETTIFKPLLLNNKFKDPNAKGLDNKAVGGSENVEFIWNLPGEEEINNRIAKISELLKGFNLSENMIRMLQLELARLMDIDGADKFLLAPEIGVDEKEEEQEDAEKKEEEKIEQPEVPGAKPSAEAKHKAKTIKSKHMSGCGCGQQLTEKQSGDMSVREFTNLKELAGFNYSDYLVRILRRLRIDKFEDLAAISDQDIANGLLSKREVNKLRIILKDGFRRNQTITQIQSEINNLDLNDRLRDGKVIVEAGRRPNMIARTETVRLANIGLLDTYKDNNIEQVRFLAALSERTCPQCESLNGQVFLRNEAEGLIPVHTMCRCTWISI